MYTKCTDLFCKITFIYVICISNLQLYLHNPSFYNVAIDVDQINILYCLVIEQECKSNRPNAKIIENKVWQGCCYSPPRILKLC